MEEAYRWHDDDGDGDLFGNALRLDKSSPRSHGSRSRRLRTAAMATSMKCSNPYKRGAGFVRGKGPPRPTPRETHRSTRDRRPEAS